MESPYEKFDAVPPECLSSSDRFSQIVLGIALVVVATLVIFL